MHKKCKTHATHQQQNNSNTLVSIFSLNGLKLFIFTIVIEDALRQATAAPVILAWLSLWVVGGLCLACPCGRFVFRQGLGRSWQILADLGQNNLLDRFLVHWGRQAAPGPAKEVRAGKKMETISTQLKSKASETDTQSDKKEALRTWEGLRSLVGARTRNRELRDYFLDVILLPNGDPVGVHF